jgi:hypothetical protein
MEVVVKLLVVSINWQDGNFYIILHDGRIPEGTPILSDQNQPEQYSLNLAESLVSVSKQWMNTSIVTSYYLEDKLNLVYKIVIPHDPALKLKDNSEWINIKKFNSYLYDEYLVKAIEKAIQGIT